MLDEFSNKVPVVSTNAGGLNDLLKNEKGISCEIKNAQMLADGINLLLENTEIKQEIVNNAFEYVNNYHSMKHITSQYLGLIKKLI